MGTLVQKFRRDVIYTNNVMEVRLMVAIIEIQVIYRKELKILIPEWLMERLSQFVNEEKLSDMIIEALTEELKKLRFRKEWEKVRSKTL
jgi:hypothetical protein